MKLKLDEIDTNQVARLGLQIVSAAGQYFTPRNVSLVDRTSQPLQSVPIDSMAGPLAGLELLASTGAVAMSAATLMEVRKLSKRINRLDRRLEGLQVTLDEIHRTVKRIDTRVSESHLREALNHCMRNAVSSDDINLQELLPLLGDIENLEETLEDDFVMNFSIQLSSDLREKLRDLLAFLQGIRYTYVGANNIAVGGDPDLSLEWHPYKDYFTTDYLTCSEMVPLFVEMFDILGGFRTALSERVESEFMFGVEEQQEGFDNLYDEGLQKPLFGACFRTEALSTSFAMWSVLDDLEVSFEDRGDVISLSRQVFHQWFANSDCSILHQLKKELLGIQHSYQEVFYTSLEKDLIADVIVGQLEIEASAGETA